MKNLLIAMCLLLLASSFVHSQNLERKGWLGIQFENVSAEEAAKNNLSPPAGVKVQQVITGSTAEAISLQIQDIIVKCNGKAIAQINDLLEIASNFRTGERLEMEILRNGNRINLHGKVIARPHEAAKNGEVIYGELPYQQGFIRTIVNKPDGEGPFPAVFYLQGYTCASIDNLDPAFTLKQFIEGLVEKGYAVFRMEKPGVGDSYNLPDCRSIDYETEINAFKKGFEKLQEISFIDNRNIFLFGHSLGGIAAPLISAGNPPNGIIVYGTVLKPWTEYMMDIYRYQRQLWGFDFLRIENDARIMFPLLSDYLVHKKTPAELAKSNPDYANALTSSLGFNERGLILDRHYTFWQQLQDKNLTEAWKNAGVNTLAIYGEADIAAINKEGHETIAAIVNAYHPGKGKFLMLPKTDHSILYTGTMEENLKLSAEERRQKPFNAKIIDIINDWMKENMVI
ncbi:MAG: PDZ domain-containing protein [Cyclobacteriaceae bacterium]|nr:PDZ domain-containing protein [Cyclobacteriaceae bacterium]